MRGIFVSGVTLPLLEQNANARNSIAPTDNSTQAENSEWSDLNAWTASLVAHEHASAGDNPDYSLFGLWTIRSGLEDQENPLDADAEAAALWFIFAGPAIKDFSNQSKSFDGRVAIAGSLFSSESWTGFNPERWNAWSQRFDALQDSISTEQTKTLVRKAVASISELDQYA